MATTTRYPIRIPLRLPRPIEPTESPASKPHRPQTPNLPPTLHTSAPCFRSNQRQPTRSNLHSLNSWPAVQCNEGFCNAPQSQCFTLTMTTASQKPHHSANRSCLQASGDSLALIKFPAKSTLKFIIPQTPNPLLKLRLHMKTLDA